MGNRHYRHSGHRLGPGTVPCAHCGRLVEPDAPGTTATSEGRYLHNACVDDWRAASAPDDDLEC
jgi:hypothetical protein